MTFTVAIVGRPNVGKSTLFNRLVGKRHAIVDKTPGVTRDRREGPARIGPLHFRAIDTAGLEQGAPESLAGRMMRQTERAIADADVALLLIDGRAGVIPLDHHFAKLLRRAETPVVVLVNKCEAGGGEAGVLEAHALGLGEPIPFSAEHGEGLSGLYDALAPFEPETAASAETEPRPAALQLAIVGRPNVGKSTLLNRLLGEERVVTGPEPGLTRDAIGVVWAYQGRAIRLIDTAGLRRRARVTEALEKLSVSDTLRAVRLAEVVIVMLDATELPAKQDLSIAAAVVEEGRAPVILFNKWDAVEHRRAVLGATRALVDESLPQAKGIRIVTCSALTGEGVKRVMPAVLAAHEVWNQRVPTAALNRWLAAAVERHAPPLAAGRRVKLRYLTQTKARPPTFAAFVNLPAALPEAYRRYLVNGLREEFGFGGVPLRLLWRKGKNPYAAR